MVAEAIYEVRAGRVVVTVLVAATVTVSVGVTVRVAGL